MSKNSPRQNLIQLKEWLEVFKKGKDTATGKRKRFSKADHYNKANNRYGGKKGN